MSNGAPVRAQPALRVHADRRPARRRRRRGGGPARRSARTSPTETAGDYPGNPARTQADDGHFVTVTLDEPLRQQHDRLRPVATPRTATRARPTARRLVLHRRPAPSRPNGSCVRRRRRLYAGRRLHRRHVQPASAQVCAAVPDLRPDGRLRDRSAHRRASCTDRVAQEVVAPVKDKTPDTGDQVIFKWSNGAATRPPTSATRCTTDRLRALRVQLRAARWCFKSTAPAAGVCGTKPCWKALGIKGFRYKDSATHAGRRRQGPPEGRPAGQGEGPVQGQGRQPPVLRISRTPCR